LETQATALKLSWTDRYETVCSQRIYGYCYGQRNVLVSKGVVGYIAEFFQMHNDDSVRGESVTIGKSSYRSINPSHSDAKIAILKEMEGVLSNSTAANAHQMLHAWAQVRKEREDARSKQYEAEKQKTAEEYGKAQVSYEKTVAQKQQARQFSISGVGLALGGFVLFGLVLAVLAIERHTRILESRDAPPAPVAPVESHSEQLV
jgi:hypothetical protein